MNNNTVYEVVLRKIEKYVLIISAASENEARELAERKVNENPSMYHDDSDVEIEIFEDI
jgi:hypothetical protein